MPDKSAIAPPHRRPRKATRWRAAAALLAIISFGCEQDSERTVQVVGSALGSTESAPDMTPDDPVRTPTARPDTGNGTGSSELPPRPGENSFEPGGEPGSDGSTRDTGGGVDGDGGAGMAPGEGDRLGGLRLLAPPPPYEAVAGKVYDMCDDAGAYAVVIGRALGPGEGIADEDRDAIAFDRRVNEVSCDEPGGRRYVYMSNVGPSGAFATAQAAVEDHNDRNRYSDENLIRRPKDIPLGYIGHLDWSFPLEDTDEVVVVEGSVLVRDGTIRGLVRSLSKTMFAREVTVTAHPAADTQSKNNNARPVSGRFPLTVQPGERAPFEIEGWAGSENPALIDLAVAAKLSDRVDITRSFSFGTGGNVTTRTLDEKFFKNFVPDFVYQAEKHKIGDDGLLMIEYLTAPTSHPSLKDQILNQNIEDLRVYMTLIGAGKVYDIVEPPLYRERPEPVHPWDYP